MSTAIRRLGLAAAMLGLLVGATRQARADLVYSYDGGGNGDKATADFKIVSGGIEIIVTNTEANTPGSGNAISQLEITFANGVTVPTSISRLTGDLVSYTHDHGSVYTESGPTNANFNPYTYQDHGAEYTKGHWLASNPDSHSITLDALPGGPAQMIISKDSTASNGNMESQSPFFNGTATFLLADSNLPSSLSTANITGVSFNFGTQPDVEGAGTGTGTSTSPGPGIQSNPEPSTIVLALSGFATMGLMALRRRSRRKEATA